MSEPEGGEVILATSNAAHVRDERAERVLSWILRVLLAGTFLMAGAMKLASRPNMVEEFEIIGLGQWFRYLTGAFELSGAVGLLLRRSYRPAAVLLGAVMVGAVIANVGVLHRPPVLPGVLLALTAAVVFLRSIRRAWAWGYGTGSLVVGVLRFIAVPSVQNLRSPEPFHGSVHILTGALFLWAAARLNDARLRSYEASLGLFYLVFGCIGLLGLVKYEDNFMHLGIGAVSIALAGRSGAVGAWRALRALLVPSKSTSNVP